MPADYAAQAMTGGDLPWVAGWLHVPHVQSHPLHALPEGAPDLAGFSTGTMAIDGFGSPADMIGHGHGPAMVRIYRQCPLGKDAPEVLIDPDPQNERAVRAYRRAGFRDIARRADGEAA